MFLNPFGLLALLAAPVVVGLHLYRRRFEPRMVSAMFLWAAEDRASVAGRKREPLRRSASFWFELLAALLLALAFAGPRLFGAGEARHLVVVLDRSASLSAGEGKSSARTRAVDAVRDRLDALPRGSRVSLVVSGPRPSLLAGPAAFVAEARARLADFEPSLGRHDLGPAIALGQELAGEDAVSVVTDRFEPDVYGKEFELIAVGEPVPNVGIVGASRRRVTDDEDDGARERVSLTLASFRGDDTSVEVALDAGGVPIMRRTIALAAGTRRHVSFDLPEDTPLLEARLTADAFPIDDRAWLAPAPRRTLALASTLSPELSQQLGLMTPGQPSNIDRWLEFVPDAVDSINPSAAHLVLATGLVGGDAWVLGLGAPGEERRYLVGPFLVDRAHPLLSDVTLEGVVWAAAPNETLAGAPLVRAGDLPLLTEATDGERVLWFANIDPRSSSLHRSPDWPVLLANAAELRRARLPGPGRTTLVIGERFTFRDSAGGRFVWQGPEGERTFDVRGELVIDDVATPGAYTLARVGAEGSRREVARVGYTFADAFESDLRQASSGVRAGRASEATVRASFSWVEVVLLAAVLAFVVLDWWVLGRRAPGVTT